MRRQMMELRALTPPDDRERYARQRLEWGCRALERGLKDTAGAHAIRGLEMLGSDGPTELVEALRSLLRKSGAKGFRR